MISVEVADRHVGDRPPVPPISGKSVQNSRPAIEQNARVTNLYKVSWRMVTVIRKEGSGTDDIDPHLERRGLQHLI